jgi:hypothetical protein
MNRDIVRPTQSLNEKAVTSSYKKYGAENNNE